jgi:ribosomal protein L37AE/L43A
MSVKILPQWAPRISQAKIRRLYAMDALGIHDQELIDDVGYALRARCQSFLEANEAMGGQALCPVCGHGVPHKGNRDDILRCGNCGWELTWGEYFQTFQHKQLSGAEPVLELFRNFVRLFPFAQMPHEKMLLIDQLIHGFHWSLKRESTRPVAVNLIEGRLGEVIAFLDSLSYGEESTPGVKEKRDEWVGNSQNTRNWGGSRTSASQQQERKGQQ